MKIYLVHNIARKNSAIQNICRAFGFDICIYEIYSQKRGGLNCISYLEIRIMLLKLELKLVGCSRGVMLKIRLILREIRNSITFLLMEKEREKILTRAWTVYLISSKHIRAWKKISASIEPYGIIFEDDVVSNENSADQVAELLKIVNQMSFNGYLDLAGGYQMADLFNGATAICQLQGGQKLLSPYPPRSNTACGYLLSREMAKSFLEVLAQNRKTRFMPIDFIINHCLGATIGPKYQCLHTYPSVLQHGSFLGLYDTWDV